MQNTTKIHEFMIMTCPSGSLNTEERYLWCNKFNHECQNCLNCSFKTRLMLAINRLNEQDREQIMDEMQIGRDR